MWGNETASCCGIMDLCGTQEVESTDEWFRETWMAVRYYKPSMLLFTAVVKYGKDTREDVLAENSWRTEEASRNEWELMRASEKTGPAVAKIIREQKLGKVRASARTVNPNHGNTIQAWLWVPNYTALEAYVGTR